MVEPKRKPLTHKQNIEATGCLGCLYIVLIIALMLAFAKCTSKRKSSRQPSSLSYQVKLTVDDYTYLW